MNKGKKNILFLEPYSGISGDMFLGSLLDLVLEESWLREVLTEIIPEKTQVKIWKDKRGEVSGTRFAVETAENPKHRNLDDILALLEESGLEADVIDKSKETRATIIIDTEYLFANVTRDHLINSKADGPPRGNPFIMVDQKNNMHIYGALANRIEKSIAVVFE